LPRDEFMCTLCTFYDGGVLSPEAAVIPGLRVLSANKNGRGDVVGFYRRLLNLVRASRPDIIHGYLDAPNIVAAMLGRQLGVPVVWGVRSSDMDMSSYGKLARASRWIEGRAAKLADLVIANSEAGRRISIARGFPADRVVVVPNGIDTDRFVPDPVSRAATRNAWNVGDDEKLVGLIGRIDPMKDHDSFLSAAARLFTVRSDVRFVCVGDGPAAVRARLQARADALGIGPRVQWIAHCEDMRAVYNALDLLALTSISEGFPNVVGEAMACGVPCVVTDVGDAALLVGDTGAVVKPRQPEQWPHAWQQMLDAPRECVAARERICERFSRNSLAQRTGALLSNVVAS
jgi:glycosyltransferase involved in cell wall biosynthesis